GKSEYGIWLQTGWSAFSRCRKVCSLATPRWCLTWTTANWLSPLLPRPVFGILRADGCLALGICLRDSFRNFVSVRTDGCCSFKGIGITTGRRECVVCAISPRRITRSLCTNFHILQAESPKPFFHQEGNFSPSLAANMAQMMWLKSSIHGGEESLLNCPTRDIKTAGSSAIRK